MIRFYFHPTPNPLKVALFLEETRINYELLPVDTRKGQQHLPEFRRISPNGKVPVIIDTEGPQGSEVRIFDSSAILLYLGEKTGRLMGSPEDKPELLSWLFFIASGLGPFSGQAIYFQHIAPEGNEHAMNRYRREAERHYEVLDKHLENRDFIVGEQYTVADISTWGWLMFASRVMKGSEDCLANYPNLKLWFQKVSLRPAAARAVDIGKDLPFKTEMDENSRKAMFPSSYPKET